VEEEGLRASVGDNKGGERDLGRESDPGRSACLKNNNSISRLLYCIVEWEIESLTLTTVSCKYPYCEATA
jgi:hypothetical protein